MLAADPYRRLSCTWHSFTPQRARAAGVGEGVPAGPAAERRSKVTFEIEPAGA